MARSSAPDPLQASVSSGAISIDPVAVSLMAGQSQMFTPTVSGTDNQAVTWSRSPDKGAIEAGLYTAPSTVTASENITVRATSAADTSKTAEAIVTLVPDAIEPSMVGPVNPDSGGGHNQLFRFDARPRNGELLWVQMLLNSALSPTHACLVYYDPPSNTIFLSVHDPPKQLLGGESRFECNHRLEH